MSGSNETLFLYHQFVDLATKVITCSSPNPHLATEYASCFKKLETAIQGLETQPSEEPKPSPELSAHKAELEEALYQKNETLHELIQQTRLLLQVINATHQQHSEMQ